MKKKIILLVLFMFPLIPICSCNNYNEANIEVIEVSNIVRYKDIRFESSNNYQGEPNAVIEMILHFQDTDYEASSNYFSNEYYIISGDKKISPLELKVGDRLYFDITKVETTNPSQAYRGYLYLV